MQQAVTEYTQLASIEQEQVWDDLTGDQARRRLFGHDGRELVGFSEEHEPRALVEDSLRELKLELAKLSGDQKNAFEKASNQSPEYVNDRAFRIKFLRAEKFDARAAAIRIGRHFEEKSKLFPEEMLTREVQLSDLDEDDMECFRTGYLQVLPGVDCANRKVVFYYKAVSDCYKQRENLLRVFWYVMNLISLKEDVQKLGVVNVVYNVGGFPNHGMDYEKSRRLARLFRAIPVRFNGFYPCVDEMAWVVVVETFAVMISRFLRIRLRIITGNHKEVCAKLMSCGIPANSMPVNDKSELLVDSHLSWIEGLEKGEETAKEPSLGPESDLMMKPGVISDLLSSTASFYQAVG